MIKNDACFTFSPLFTSRFSLTIQVFFRQMITANPSTTIE